jgi:hypothetical protein
LLRAWLDIERERPPFTVAAVEVPLMLVLDGVAFRMRLDRIDVLAGGGVAILDYKTGRAETPRQWFDARPRASQLGLYALAQRFAQPSVSVRAVAYGQLRTDAIGAIGLSSDADAWPALTWVGDTSIAADWQTIEKWWQRHLGALATEIAAAMPQLRLPVAVSHRFGALRGTRRCRRLKRTVRRTATRGVPRSMSRARLSSRRLPGRARPNF